MKLEVTVTEGGYVIDYEKRKEASGIPDENWLGHDFYDVMAELRNRIENALAMMGTADGFTITIEKESKK